MQVNWSTIAKVIRQHSVTFFYSSLLFYGKTRKATWAVYAACRLGDDAVDKATNPQEALQAWWSGIERAYAGKPDEMWERALTWTLEHYSLPKEAFEDIKLGFEADLQGIKFSTLEHLLSYCYQVAGTVGLLMIPICGGSPAARPYAIKLGQAMQLTNCLRDVGEDLDMDRLYLPLDLLKAYSISLQELQAGKRPTGYNSLMEELARAAEELYHQGIVGLNYLSNGRIPIALAALQYKGILDKLRSSNWDNLQNRAHLRIYERLLLLPKALYTVYK